MHPAAILAHNTFGGALPEVFSGHLIYNWYFTVHKRPRRHQSRNLIRSLHCCINI